MTLPKGADYSLTESALIPFQAEPTQNVISTGCHCYLLKRVVRR